MRRREAQPDPRQGGLFDCRACAGPPAARATGSLQFDAAWREALSHAIAESGLTREQIAAEMERLVGNDPEYPISKAMLDAWTAPSRGAWRFPVIYLPAFVAVTGAHCLLEMICRRCDRVAVTDEEARHIELGRVKREIKRLQGLERDLLRGATGTSNRGRA